MVIKVWVETDQVGSRIETEIEVDDTATEEEIEQEVREAALERVTWGWDRKEPR